MEAWRILGLCVDTNVSHREQNDKYSGTGKCNEATTQHVTVTSRN